MLPTAHLRNRGRARIGLVVIALAIPLLLAPLASADVTADVNVDVRSANEAQVTVRQVWSGQVASDFRQSLDAIFGDGNGRLDATEVERIVNATEADVANKSFPMIVFDGTAGHVTQVTLTLENATGDVSDETDITTTHDLVLALQPAANETHELAIQAIRNGSATVTVPADWTVSTAGAAGDAGPATATLMANETATFSLGPAPAGDGTGTGNDGGDGDSEREVQAENRGLPGAGLAATLLAIAFVALLGARSRRRT